MRLKDPRQGGGQPSACCLETNIAHHTCLRSAFSQMQKKDLSVKVVPCAISVFVTPLLWASTWAQVELFHQSVILISAKKSDKKN